MAENKLVMKIVKDTIATITLNLSVDGKRVDI